MLRRSVVAGGMVLVLIASAASAQPPKGPGGPGGPPRFGGPGGPPGFGGPGGMRVSNLMMLLAMPAVQKELKLDDQQQEQVKELRGELQKQTRSPFGGLSFQEIQKLTQEERNKLFAEAQKKAEQFNKQADEKVGKILDAGQLERLEQLRLQREGVAAFNRPEIAKRLGLSEAQQAKIRKIQEEARRPAAGGFPGPDATEEERREFFTRIQKQREKVQADILAVLTEEQQQKWSEMKGKEFKFPQPQGPGGFGPGGPGGPGGKAGERRRPPAQKEE